jgi:hypothetical protein
MEGKELLLNINNWVSVESNKNLMVESIKKLQIERQETLELPPDEGVTSISEALNDISDHDYNQLLIDYCEKKTSKNGSVYYGIKA